MEIRKAQKNFVNKLNVSSGFTLIELIVAMVILGVISYLLVMYIMGSTEAFSRVQSRKSLIIDATSSLKKFNREAGLTYKILFAIPKNFRFTTSLDTNIVIEYEINNDGTFTRKLGAGNKEFLSRYIDFDASYFNYYDVNDNVATLTTIRRIRLSLLFSRNNESSRFTADISPETLRVPIAEE